MNIAVISGNIVRDPELKTTTTGISVVSFTVAVQRNRKNADGEYEADFINCVAWRQTAEFISKYFKKGSGIGLTGNLETRKYTDKNGNDRHITEFIVREAEFKGKKEKEETGLDESGLPF